jgi:hypothetical protein
MRPVACIGNISGAMHETALIAEPARRLCRAYDKLRSFLRPRSRHPQHVPANCRTLQFLLRSMTVLAILQAA